MSQNPSGLKPLGRAVLIKHYEAKKKSLIELPPSVLQQQILIELIAVNAVKLPKYNLIN